MVKELDTVLTVKDVVASPVDEVLEGVIVKIEKGLLSEFVPAQVHDKFDNLEQETLNIHFETKYNDKNLKGTDRIAFYEEPMTNSKLGKFLTKYEELKVGTKIKVDYDEKGFGSIRLK